MYRRLGWASTAAMLAALLFVLGCPNNNDSTPRAPTVSQTDFNTLSSTVRQNQERLGTTDTRLAAAEKANTTVTPRVVAVEQRVAALERNIGNLTQEIAVLRQQQAQMQMELTATQEQLRRLQAQAGAARRKIRNAMGGNR